MTNSAQTVFPCTYNVADLVVWHSEVDSTNTVARHLLADGTLSTVDTLSLPIAVIAADRQTAGRGRLGRQWVSRAGESSTLTYATVVPASIALDESINGWLQMIAGLASVDAIRAVCSEAEAQPVHSDCCRDDYYPDDCRLMLKWPNDVFLHNHKLGGILAELVPLSASASTGAANVTHDGDDTSETSMIGILFGIGLNLGVPANELPTELSTSLQLHRTPLPTVIDLRDRIAVQTVTILRSRLERFITSPQTEIEQLHREIHTQCWTLGRNVKAQLANGSVLHGEAVSVNNDASLMIRTTTGELHIVRTGDVGVL